MANPGQGGRLRLFYALWPDEGVRDKLEGVARQWRRATRFSGRPIRAERYHITLAFLGDVETGAPLDAVFGVGARVAGAPFELHLDRVGSFGRRHHWIGWAGASETPEALVRLNRGLTDALRAARLPCDTKPFCPHVTLFRNLVRREPRALTVDISWPVREFVLVSSALPPAPAEYTILARYALASALDAAQPTSCRGP